MAFSADVEEEDYTRIIRLTDRTNGTSIEIYSFGALLNAFTVSARNGRKNVIDGFSSPTDARENITKGFKSAKLSPFVCRMDKGEYFFDGPHKIQKFYLGEEAIHGLLYNAPFTVEDFSSTLNSASVHLTYAYNNKNEGFPFPYAAEVIYTLTAGNDLRIETIITNTGMSDMPLNDGWHPYFMLGGTVDDLEVEFNADSMLEFDSRLMPTGNIIPYKRFSGLQHFGDTTLDNCFLLKNYSSPACILRDKASGLECIITAGPSYSYLQVYTPPHRKSIAVENLSSAPDSFNNGIGLVIAKPGERYSFAAGYQIKTF